MLIERDGGKENTLNKKANCFQLKGPLLVNLKNRRGEKSEINNSLPCKRKLQHNQEKTESQAKKAKKNKIKSKHKKQN